MQKTNQYPPQAVSLATQCLTGLLGIFLSESDIFTVCQTAIVFDKRALAVRETVRRLCLIFAGKEKHFSLTAKTLKTDSILLDIMCENSFFYDKALTETCRYLVPGIITKGNGIHELLKPLLIWKQNPSFQRFPALAMVLMLYLLQWLVIVDQRLCDHLHILLRTLIYSRPENLIQNFYLQLNDIISKINLEEEHEDE